MLFTDTSKKEKSIKKLLNSSYEIWAVDLNFVIINRDGAETIISSSKFWKESSPLAIVSDGKEMNQFCSKILSTNY